MAMVTSPLRFNLCTQRLNVEPQFLYILCYLELDM
jgi:hypothetical protein